MYLQLKTAESAMECMMCKKFIPKGQELLRTTPVYVSGTRIQANLCLECAKNDPVLKEQLELEGK